jgi:hypothetical protein
VLAIAGIAAPPVVDGVDQQPIDGASLVPTFADRSADAPRDTQYFEMLGSRAMVRGRWKATTDHISQGVPDEELLDGSRDFDTDRWALFDLDADFSEARNVAGEYPHVVQELEALWWSHAGRYNVLPLDDTLVARLVALEPSPHPPRYRWAFRPGSGPIAEDATPPLAGGFRLRAEIDPVADAAPPSGVLCAQGDWTNGWAFVVLDGHLTYLLSRFGVPHSVRANQPIAAGTTEVRMEYTRANAGGGVVSLFEGNAAVGEGRLPHDLPFRWQIGGARFSIGCDQGFPVSDDYRVPFAFSGTIRRVEFEIPGLAFLEQAKAEAHTALATD